MKRILIVVLAGLIMIALVGCGGSPASNEAGKGSGEAATQAPEPESEKEDAEEPMVEETEKAGSGGGTIATKAPTDEAEVAFDGDAVLNNLEITPSQYITDNYYYVFLVVKNNSDLTADIYGDMTFLDADGKPVGTASSEIEVLEPGCESIMSFQNDIEFDTYEYQLKASDNEYYDGALSTLICDVNLAENKAILSVTNNGDKAAQFVEYTVLFFAGDEVVSWDWGYCVDDDSEIKPGETQMAEARAYEDFDTAIAYLNGRADK